MISINDINNNNEGTPPYVTISYYQMPPTTTTIRKTKMSQKVTSAQAAYVAL